MSVTIHCTVRAETDNAIKVLDHDTGEELWLPLSQVDKIVRDRDGKGAVTMTNWIAIQKGLL